MADKKNKSQWDSIRKILREEAARNTPKAKAARKRKKATRGRQEALLGKLNAAHEKKRADREWGQRVDRAKSDRAARQRMSLRLDRGSQAKRRYLTNQRNLKKR